jgi:hypothetical protein
MVEYKILIHPLGHRNGPITETRQHACTRDRNPERPEGYYNQSRPFTERVKEANDHFAVVQRLATGNIVTALSKMLGAKSLLARQRDIIGMDRLPQASC